MVLYDSRNLWSEELCFSKDKINVLDCFKNIKRQLMASRASPESVHKIHVYYYRL